ncbi:MAG: hypothetical protein J4G15_05155 [Alphaproteobacteria bacterium]|nr:hypothetical protein [Alphaproteobacteria bacterium]
MSNAAHDTTAPREPDACIFPRKLAHGRVLVSDGDKLDIANLIDMAPAINAATVTLSGFLERPSASILDTYRQAGYAPRATTIIDDRATLAPARDPAGYAHGAARCRSRGCRGNLRASKGERTGHRSN